MTDLTVVTFEAQGGYNFRRSDEERFSLICHADGSADLYAGVVDRNNPPQKGIVHLKAGKRSMREMAERCVLAYPNCPAE